MGRIENIDHWGLASKRFHVAGRFIFDVLSQFIIDRKHGNKSWSAGALIDQKLD